MFLFVFELKPRFIAAPYQGAQNVSISQRALVIDSRCKITNIQKQKAPI
jgi:hypothetical protein